MPLSTDNQDFDASDDKNANKENSAGADKKTQNDKLSSDNLKGKKVDADPEKETDKPAST